jgi:hypothetical protein
VVAIKINLENNCECANVNIFTWSRFNTGGIQSWRVADKEGDSKLHKLILSRCVCSVSDLTEEAVDLYFCLVRQFW